MSSIGSKRPSSSAVTPAPSTPPELVAPSVTALLPIIGVVFVAYLVIGLAMPVLPLHVHQRLGLSTFMVGLVVGSQFAAALVSRIWAGHYSDTRGGKRAVVAGLPTAARSGLFFLLSFSFFPPPQKTGLFLFLCRVLLGTAGRV